MCLIPFVVMAFRVAARKASAPEVALVGLLPVLTTVVLTTVAMITQYQMLVWLALGAAVAFYAGTQVAAPPPVGGASRQRVPSDARATKPLPLTGASTSPAAETKNLFAPFTRA